jgi:hypothetical protein
MGTHACSAAAIAGASHFVLAGRRNGMLNCSQILVGMKFATANLDFVLLVLLVSGGLPNHNLKIREAQCLHVDCLTLFEKKYISST